MLVPLFLIGCASKQAWQFKTQYFGISVNDKGYITSMKNITTKQQREFSPADKPSPLLSLYDSQKKVYYTPERGCYDKKKGLFTLNYPNGATATVLMEPKAKYLKMTLKDLTDRNGVDAVQWGSYYTNITNLMGEIIGVARDTSEAVNYSIGMLALNDNTLGGTADIEGDAPPFQYIIHTPDKERFPLPSHLHEGKYSR